MMNASKRRVSGQVARTSLPLVLASALICTACAGESGHAEIGQLSQRLTADQARILGFESVATDWSSVTGSLGSSDQASQGEAAMTVVPNGWTTIESPTLSSLGEHGSVASLDIRLPDDVGWGTLQVTLMAPSAGVHYYDVGSMSLVGLAPNVYHTLYFNVPEYIREDLSEEYGDLKIQVHLNGPTLGEPYLIDNLVLTTDSENPPPGPGVGLAMSLPQWAQPSRSPLVALEELRVNDGTQVTSGDGAFASLASLGTSPTNIGQGADVGSIQSVPNVVLRNYAEVHGSVTTSGQIESQAGADVHGTKSEGYALRDGSVEFSLPAISGADAFPTEGEAVPPGSYRSVVIQNGDVTFTTGVYWIGSLVVGAAQRLLIDDRDGPVVVVVSGSATLHGTVDAADGGYPQWILGYAGTQEIPITSHLDGSIFAPNAKVNVAGNAQHTGAILAGSIEIQPGSQFAYQYDKEAWLSLCDVADSQEGFCAAPAVDYGIENCIFAHQPWLVGRNEHNPFGLLDLLKGLLFIVEPQDYGILAATDWPVLRTLAIDPLKRAMVVNVADDVRLIGASWSEKVAVNAVAWGDIDGDGLDELLVGRSKIDDKPRAFVYDDVETEYRELQQLFSGWGDKFGVRAIATGDIDGDGREEVAVARDEASDGLPEVFILTSVLDAEGKLTLNEVHSMDMGNRDANDVAFGDLDGDGAIELVIGLGGAQTQADRVRIYDFAPGEDWATVAPTFRSIGDWGSDRHAKAVAVGDADGDGTLELAVGRSKGVGDLYFVFEYDLESDSFQEVFAGGEGWGGEERSVNDLDFGDIDGDGDDELIVGRDEDPGDSDAKAFVFDVDGDGVWRELTKLGSNWGANRAVTAVATGDIDGDGKDEILLGRNKGGGGRVKVFDGPDEGFAEIVSFADGWDDSRSANALAVSSRYVCETFEPQELPGSVAAADNALNSRTAVVIGKSFEAFSDALSGTYATPEDHARAVFGEWSAERWSGSVALRRILAGLSAIQLGTQGPGDDEPEIPALAGIATQLSSAGFPDLVSAYINSGDLSQTNPVGTNGDFDFVLMSALSVLYRFRTLPELLDDASVDRLLRLDCSGAPDYQDCPDHTALHPLLYAEGPICVAETENHSLMIYTWDFLVHQWQSNVSPRQGELLPAEPSPVRTRILSMIGRVMHNDLWETNARSYEAFTLRALHLLASYSADDQVRRAAENAAHFIAAKYAFQSFHGKRLPPMRRNWDYRGQYGLYQHDYLPAQLGVLVGDTTFATDCDEYHCGFSDSSSLGFALEAVLSKYRIPAAIADHMLRPDGGRPGYGSWARMQGRYQEYDYALGEPSYGSNYGLAVEPAHEFYFRTAGYLNSAGGRSEKYSTLSNIFNEAYDKAQVAAVFLDKSIVLAGALELGQDAVEEQFEDTLRSLDFVARPSMLIGGADTGYWRGLSSAMLQTELFKGDGPSYSNNTGVCKNLTVGYGMSSLPRFTVAAAATVGSSVIKVYDPASTRSIFPYGDYYLVVGSLTSTIGFYEVIPRKLFATPEDALFAVLSNQDWASDPYSYRMTVSGEFVKVNPSYPSGVPFESIDGDPSAVSTQHYGAVSETQYFPLIDVREVDDTYNFTGTYYACGTGDGLVVVDNPALNERLILDSRDPQAPSNAVVALDTQTQGCMQVFGGVFE